MFGLIVLLGCLLSALPVFAQHIDSTGRFGLTTSPLRYEQVSANDVSSGDVSVGLGTPGFGLTFGGGLSDSAEIGASVLITHRAIDLGSNTAKLTELQLIPHADYVFPSDDSTRPFLGGRVGVSVSIPGGGEKSTTFLFGPAAGAHFFVGPHASIELGAHAFYLMGSSAGVGVTGFSLGVDLGVSAFWGGAAEHAASAPAEQAPAWQPASSTVGAASAGPVAQRSEAGRSFDRARDEYVLKARFELGSAWLMLTSVPQEQLQTVELHLAAPRYAAPSRDCQQLSALINARPTDVGAVARSEARGYAILEGQLTYESFKPLGRAHATFGIEACGKQWTLAESQMPDLIKFLELVSQVAVDVQHGALPVRAPASPAQPQAPQAQPQAQPQAPQAQPQPSLPAEPKQAQPSLPAEPKQAQPPVQPQPSPASGPQQTQP